MIRRIEKGLARRLAAALVAALAILLHPLPSEATSPVRLGRKSLTASVTRTLLAKTETGRRVLDLVKDDPRAARGLVQLARLSSRPGQTNKQVVASLARMMFLLERDLQPQGPARLRTVLGDVTTLVDWSRNQPAARAELEKIAAGMTKARNLTKGGAYEIHLAAGFVGPPPSLREIQPLAGPNDSRLFRDALIERSGKPAFVEAKNWPNLAEELGEKKLRAQVDNHFERLLRANKAVEPIPPGHQLVFHFNDRMPPAWEKAIRESTISALKSHFKLPDDRAVTWVTNNLNVSVRSIVASP